MKVGTKNVIAMKLGSVNISRAYLGSTLVWEAGSAPGGESYYGVESWTSPGSTTSIGQRCGWTFTVGGSDLNVTSLRHFGAGLGAAVWRVMIHRNNDDAVMATADITKVQDDYAEEAVTPVTLAAGVSYTISGRGISGSVVAYRNPTGVVHASGFTVDNTGVFGTASDLRPTSNTSNAYIPPADFGFTVL